MNARTCRDCGNLLEQDARGCPQCALNLEAENMIDRIIWRRFVPGVILVVLAIALVYWLR
jgi:predicted amidophosphoribosyltransferase